MNVTDNPKNIRFNVLLDSGRAEKIKELKKIKDVSAGEIMRRALDAYYIAEAKK